MTFSIDSRLFSIHRFLFRFLFTNLDTTYSAVMKTEIYAILLATFSHNISWIIYAWSFYIRKKQYTPHVVHLHRMFTQQLFKRQKTNWERKTSTKFVTEFRHRLWIRFGKKKKQTETLKPNARRVSFHVLNCVVINVRNIIGSKSFLAF